MFDSSSSEKILKDLRDEVKRYPIGVKLPSNRELVKRYQASAGTVSRAIAALAAEGLVDAVPGSGVFRARERAKRPGTMDCSWQEVSLNAEPGGLPATVRHDAASLLAYLQTPPPGAMDLASGYPHSSLQPEQALSSAHARAGRRPGAWTRPPVEGIAELREWFARDIGSAPSPSDVLICAGGQSALVCTLRSLAQPGAAVLVESPTYPGVLAAARAAGLRPVPVPVDADGVRVELLAKAFTSSGAGVFVCQPLFQNPTGATLAAERRAPVLEAARAAGAFVVEDDFVRRLGHGAPLLAPLVEDDQDGRVVHIHSLTKATSPNLRIAALVARGAAFERLRTAQVIDNFFVPKTLQETALELVGSPAWPRHLRSLAAELRERKELAVAALGEHLPEFEVTLVPKGGYHLWLRLPEDSPAETDVVASARRAGVLVTAGGPYFASEPSARFLRLSYAAAPSAAGVRDGVRRLAEGWRSVGAS
ncbi:MAG: PLP-dependent aminotransferase family protein [Segniliparus sp.]|uniref:aminotransferase-like domain-containing protein n=1 Tax=Segniliparus sp. TaxID=2804064 RepID=UPI003F35E2F6